MTEFFSVGLMSGTSMDGIDAALLRTDGINKIQEIAHTAIQYTPEFKILLKAAEFVVRKCEGDLTATRNYYPTALFDYLKALLKIEDVAINAQMEALVTYLNVDKLTFDAVVQHSTQLHGELVKKLLQQTEYAAAQIDVIGYHGQTLFHNPTKKITIQVGDGQALAKQLGVTVVNDFRSQDVAMGGQGAPFAPLYHQALAVRDNKIPLAVVNCGGIANITLITGETDQDVIGFDTGPGNGLIDRYIRQYTRGKETIDLDGKYGKTGNVDETVLKALHDKAIFKENGNYFMLPPPKSLDINDLQLIPELEALSLPDACATLEAFTAQTIVDSLALIKTEFPKQWILAGGGWNNPVILREFKKRLREKLNDAQILTANEAGWNSQAMEAQIFAYLAVRSLKKLPLSLPSTTRVPKPLSGGQIHIPG
jgi:anhydro-N-acetylmuramic acid kinase